MAQLDQFMSVMLDEADAELFVGANAAPRLLRGGKERELIPRKLSPAQVRHLLAEIVPPAVQTLLNARGSAEFVYNLGGRESVQVTILDWAGNTESSFRSARASSSSRLVAAAAAPRDAAPSSERVGAATPERRPIAMAPERPPAPAPASGIPSERRLAPSQPSLAAVVARSPERRSSSDDIPRAQPVADKNLIDVFFRDMVGLGSSDLHMSTGEYPMVRKDGEMKRLSAHSVLTQEFMEQCLFPIMPPRNRKQYEDVKDADFAYEIEGLSRFRCNVFMDRKGIGAVFRTIPTKIITVEDLGLSKPIQNLCYLTKGLVLVTGPTGSGKSTTLSALVDFVNRERHDHIITIEDPIEFVHPNKNCLVNQREVGEHTMSFKNALRAALREDPDIVLVGEMRDLETIAIAIETAETGHLVFGTLHTSTAYSTVDRIIDQFPADRQAQIRVMLSESLKGVISQTLCRKMGGGRIAALEVLLGTPAVANLIREGKTFQIPSIMQTSKKMGMQLLNDALLELVLAKKVEPKEAYTKAIDKANFVTMAKQANIALEFLGGVV